MPDVVEVAGQPARQQEDGIDANVVTLTRVARRQPFGGNRHPAQPVLVERNCQPLLAAARLDLDEGQDSSPARDEVDLAARYARPLGEDPPAAKSQPPGRQPFRAPAAPLRLDPPVQRLSSRARA